MVKTPRKAGVIVSLDSAWEIAFCFLALEKHEFQRMPITVSHSSADKQISEIEGLLARRTLVNLADAKATGIDTVIITGGERMFKSQCNFDEAGEAFKVDDELKTFIKGMYRLGKPIGAFGPASALVTKALQGIASAGPVVTVGNDPKLQVAITSAGGQAVATRPGEVILDETNRLATSGGELASKRPSEVFESCENLVSGLVELINKSKD